MSGARTPVTFPPRPPAVRLPVLPGAGCAGSDPDLWFSAIPARQAQAAAICHACPVQAACLAWAEAAQVAFGMWGGTRRDRDGHVARRARSRARRAGA